MLANKLVKTPVNLDIKELTLLTEEEAMTLLTKEQRSIRKYGFWWLRTSLSDKLGRVSSIGEDGELYVGPVDAVAAMVPALKISNIKSLGLKIGDKVHVAGETWSIISDDLAWCSRAIGLSYFREETMPPDDITYFPDINEYEKSDVKKQLDKWAFEKALVTRDNMEQFNMSQEDKTAQASKLNPETVDFDIEEITLLSVEEAESLLTKYPNLVGHSVWWLRTAGSDPYNAWVVYFDRVQKGAHIADDNDIRPVLRISNLKSLNISEGDQIEVGGESWTVISDNLALCDRFVGRTQFRHYSRASTAMLYEKSDGKRWINKWALEKGIMTQENIEMFHVR